MYKLPVVASTLNTLLQAFPNLLHVPWVSEAREEGMLENLKAIKPESF